MVPKAWRSGTRALRIGWVLLAAAGGLGCGGGSGGTTTPTTNHAPTASAAVAPSPVVMGQTTQLTTQATDPDGDSLSYSWAQTAPASPQGSFSAQSSSSTSWTAPTVSAITPFTLSVTVSDGRGGTGTGTVTVYAKPSADPSFIADVQPLLLVLCFGGCHTTDAGRKPLAEYATLVSYRTTLGCTGQLLVQPGDPDNSVLFKRMSGTACGERMPSDSPTYFDTHSDQLNLVRTWILQGAANN